MSEPIGINTWGGGNRKTRGKESKLDLIIRISKKLNVKILDLNALNIKDLKSLLQRIQNIEVWHEMVIPNSRTKRPYLDELDITFPNIQSMSKLSVASLQALMGACNGILE